MLGGPNYIFCQDKLKYKINIALKNPHNICVCKYKIYKLFAKLHPCLIDQYNNVIIEVSYEVFFFFFFNFLIKS